MILFYWGNETHVWITFNKFLWWLVYYIFSTGTGSIVAAVKIPAHREPLVIGKPGKIMFDMLHEEHGLDAEKTIMVGDRSVGNSGSYMSAHVLLNLLNMLGKRDKMRGLPSIFSLFRNTFNKFNNTRAQLLDSIYYMTFRLLWNLIPAVKTL